MLQVISIMRGVVEMLGLCLMGQGMLYLITGKGHTHNLIYQLFSVITRGPRRLVAVLLPASSSALSTGVATFAVLLVIWLGLAYLRNNV